MVDPSDAPSFAELFGVAAEVSADAPGRVNLIGEHTDYQNGFVLPIVIPQRTRVDLRACTDRRVRAWTAAEPGGFQTYELGRETRAAGWIDYVQGVTHALLTEGVDLPGLDIRVESTVPRGSGLSSSAALEVALLRALRARFGLELDDRRLALVAHRAETGFVGAPVGVMDQFVSSLGRPDAALFLDTRDLTCEHIPVHGTLDLVVIDSGVKHQHASGEYATRHRESFDAAAQLGVTTLRELPLEAMPRVADLPPPFDRRARHILTENARVPRAADALRAGNLDELGALLNASHASLRDDYEVSIPETDALVEIAQAQPSVFGARLTGGGFGGCVVAIARRGAGLEAATRMLRGYKALMGRIGTRLLPLDPS